jgi:hypothetical protein
MPAIMCICNYKISYTSIPAPDMWLCVSDVEYDSCFNKIDAQELYTKFTHMHKCPNCERLWIFWNGYGLSPTVYKVELDKEKCNQ